MNRYGQMALDHNRKHRPDAYSQIRDPAASLDIMHDFDEKGRLAPNTRATLGLDLTVGWVF